MAVCTCEAIARQEQHITISTAKKRYGKIVTIIEGLTKDVDIKDIAKKLKTEFACGGTVKKDIIELQGNHSDSAKSKLISLGFSAEMIEG